MVDLDKRIADLEKKIEGYKDEYKTATTEKEKDRLTGLIKVKSETLNKLLDQKAQSGGNSLRHLMRRELYSVLFLQE